MLLLYLVGLDKQIQDTASYLVSKHPEFLYDWQKFTIFYQGTSRTQL
jgi:hypothetical protein